VADERLDVDLNVRVRFWMCINRDHKRVVWHDDVAHCPDCGVTSAMTSRYAESVRKYHRDDAVELAAELVKAIRAHVRDQFYKHRQYRGVSDFDSCAECNRASNVEVPFSLCPVRRDLKASGLEQIALSTGSILRAALKEQP
jgi:hypothetical protein